MADNVTIPTTGSGTATPVIATDDVASVHYQKVKIALGADGAIDTLLDSGQQLAANSAPMVLASDHSDIKITLDGEQVVISGTVQVQSNSANLATQTTAAAILAAVELLDTAVSESAFNVGIVAGGPLGFAAEPEATGDGNIIGILKRLRTLLEGTLTVSTELPSAAALADNTANPTVPGVGAFTMVWDGAFWDRAPGTTADGALVNLGANNDVTVTGTVAVTQSGTWDEVGVNDSGNSLTVDAPVTTPVYVRLSDGIQAISTLPVSLASVPSHAVTNAGTFATQVDGAALTALQLIDNLVLAEDAAHGSGDPGVQALAVRKDTGATIAGTDGGYSPLQVDSSGNLRVNVAAGGAGDGAILDGVSSSIKATVLDYTGSNPLAVRLTDTAGDYVGAGAGTQYTEDAAAAADPTGTALILVRDDSLAGSLTTANGDNVAARGNNKGEQYTKDTDAAALLTTIDTDTGNIATSMAVIDDWDESDRAKVNVIAGQAGVTAGAGAVAANTPRVTLASDDPAVVALQLLDNAVSGAGFNVTQLGGAAVPLGGGTEATAVRVTIASDSTGVVSVDDNGGSLTVDGTVAISGTVTVASHAVTNAGTFAVQESGAALTALQLIDDAIFAEDVAAQAADKGIQVLAVRRDADTSLVGTDNDYAPLQVNANGALKVEIFDGGDSHTIDGTVTANLAAGTNNIGDVDVLSIAAGDNNIGNVDIVTVPAPLSTTGGGTEAAALRVTIASDSTGVLSVDDNGGSLTVDAPVGTPVFVRLSDGAAAITTLPVSLASVPSHAVTNAGTFAVQAVAAGDVANDGADSGNPVKVGSVAYNFDGTVPGTAVAEGDRVNQVADVYGRQFVETTHPNYWTLSADYASAQTNASLKTAPGASLKLYITDVIISNGATAGNVTLLDGSGGTVKLELYPGVNGGLAHSFRTPIALTANTALCITSTTVTTHSVTICGYTAP